MISNEQQIKNRLTLELDTMISEFKNGDLNEEIIINYFRQFLQDAEVDSQIIVDVLEEERFGELGKEEARSIKVEEGW